MKKSIIISIAAVVVIAIVYFLFIRKKEEESNDEGNTGTANIDTSAGSLSEEDKEVLKSAMVDQQNSLITVDSEYTTAFTEDEATEYEELLIKYKQLTDKTDGKNYSLTTLKALVEEAQETYDKARLLESLYSDLIKANEINTKKSAYNDLSKLAVYEKTLEELHNRAEAAGKGLYEDLKNGTKWYYSSSKKKNYFHKDLGNAWNEDNMKELLDLSKETSVNTSLLKQLVNNTFKAQPKTTIDVYPAKATDDQVSNGRWKGNSSKKTYELNGQSIATVLNGINNEWKKARTKATGGVDYATQVANAYAGL